MKKIIFVLVVVLFSSCLGAKKIIEKSKETAKSEKNEVKKDSSNVKEKNGAIKDRIVVNVPKTDNKEVMQMFNNLLSQLNTSKSSGTNSYRSRYDKEKDQLIIDFVVAATENLKVITNTESKEEKTFEQKTNEYYKKVITTMPWYLWVLAYFVFLDGKVVALLSNFIPGLKGATSILSFLNFSNKSS